MGKRRYTKPKRSGQNRLPSILRTSPASTPMVDFDCKVIVWIIRQSQILYDTDDFVAGCKTLRDAIAAALSFKGDALKDGITFCYEQKTGPQKIIIKVFKNERHILQKMQRKNYVLQNIEREVYAPGRQ